MLPLIFNGSQLMSAAPRNGKRNMLKYDSSHKYWELAVEEAETDPQYEPSELCKLWDMLDAFDERKERQAAGLEAPDPYIEEGKGGAEPSAGIRTTLAAG
jgi:hypothetical protein